MVCPYLHVCCTSHTGLSPQLSTTPFDIMALLHKLCAEWQNTFRLSLMECVTLSTASLYYRENKHNQNNGALYAICSHPFVELHLLLIYQTLFTPAGAYYRMTLALILFLTIFLHNEKVNCPELHVVVSHDNIAFRHETDFFYEIL